MGKVLGPPVGRGWVALLCTFLVISGATGTYAGQAQPPPPASAPPAAETKLPPEQLDSLVAPIALYPDPMLSQVLVASTYPLEIVQLQQWLEQNKGLKDQALADAVAKQDWDPSIQAMAAMPDIVNRLAGNIRWTAELGNAFLAQESDVMDAVQRMRVKAHGGVRSTGVPVSSDRLSAAGILCRRDGDFVRDRTGDGSRMGRRLGLEHLLG